MKMIIRSMTLGLALLLWCNRTGAQTTMTDDEIRKLLRDQVEHLQSPGIVVGLIDAHGSKVLAYGKTAREGGIDVDGDTVFEIGSATKVFTGLLLAEMAQHGEVKLDDPIGKYLPPGVKSPERKGREITLLDLALHRSGLPRLPDNFASKNPEDPYADYTFENVCAFLSGYALTRDIDTKYEYSNLGAGLLGCLLARHAGTNYETLVIERICRPLGMTSTAIMLSPELKRRFATGHDAALQPVKPWDFDALAGCGAIRSTANDLLKFLSANMGLMSGDLWPAMQRMQEPLGTTDVPNTQIGIAWHITDRDGRRIIWHNGQTAGFHSCVAFDPTNKVGVVLLANAGASLDPLAFRLITPNAGASNSAPHSDDSVLRLETAPLKRFVGKYELSPGVTFNLRLDGNHLMAQLTGQDYYEIFPKSETNFFYKVVNAQIGFNCEASGKVRSLTLHQGGLDQDAHKVSDEAPVERKAMAMKAAAYDQYAGEYQLAPGAVFTIRRDGDRLLAKLTGQSFLQIYPESELNFFYKEVDAQISFIKGADGNMTALVLHQNGRDLRAEKTR